MTQTIEPTTYLSRGFIQALIQSQNYIKKGNESLGCVYIKNKALYATDGFILLECFNSEFPEIQGALTVPKLGNIQQAQQQGNFIRLSDSKGNPTIIAVDTGDSVRYPQKGCDDMIQNAKRDNSIMINCETVQYVTELLNMISIPKKGMRDLIMQLVPDEYINCKIMSGDNTPMITLYTAFRNVYRHGSIDYRFNVALLQQAFNTFNDLAVNEITMYLNTNNLKPIVFEGYSNTLNLTVRTLIMPMNRA